jgi:hypothetical protein
VPSGALTVPAAPASEGLAPPRPTLEATSHPLPRQAALVPEPLVAEVEPAAPPPREVVLERANSLAFRLSRELGVPVRLSVTDNRSTMVSFRRGPSTLTVRVHHMFLDAPDAVVRALRLLRPA